MEASAVFAALARTKIEKSFLPAPQLASVE
jgi:hypothetical protein